MNYYNEIKEQIINNEIKRGVRNYSQNKNDLETYYNVGKLLSEAGKHYGENIIGEYSNKLISELGKKYTTRTLRRYRQFYNIFKNEKWTPLATKLTWTHYSELLSIKDINKINYYIEQSIKRNLSKRELRNIIKTKEYERLDEETRLKLINKEESDIKDFIKNLIIIKNTIQDQNISEKLLHEMILQNIESFMKELGDSFCFVGSEYKIKIGDRYNYIDLLLFNYEYNSFVVVELKVTELKKEHIGQIKLYMNYIDKNLRKLTQDKTIGIIICKKENKFVIEYCSDDRILSREYQII